MIDCILAARGAPLEQCKLASARPRVSVRRRASRFGGIAGEDDEIDSARKP